MALKDYLRSLLAELAGRLPLDRRRNEKPVPWPAPGIDPPGQPNREEVQYPGYFEGKGRL